MLQTFDWGYMPGFHGCSQLSQGSLGGCHCELSCGRESVILKISAMMWDNSESHATVIALHKMGKLTSKFLLPLRSWKSAKVCVSAHQTTNENWNCCRSSAARPPKQYQDQEAGSKSGGLYSVKSYEKAVSDSSKAEHIQDVHVRCVKKWAGTESLSAEYRSLPHPAGAGSSMHACHAAGQGLIHDRDKFPGWGFFLTCQTNVKKL